MRRMTMQQMMLSAARRAVGLVALGLACLALGANRAAAQVKSVSGEAFGVLVDAGGAPVTLAAAMLPANGGMDAADLDNGSVAGSATSGWMTTTTTGAIGAAAVSSQSTSSVEDVDILNGVVTAKLVVAVASSAANAARATSDANGSVFTDLAINGAPVGAGDFVPRPNTRVDLPGVGFAILNEQTTTGDGVSSAGMAVNMIHLVLQDPVTGAQTGEIILGSARSAVAF